MANSEFAKRQLKKHGWTEGAGLGRDEHGRADPIKVSLKMDKTGVGHDPGKEFTDHWWLRVFNETAQKIGKKDRNESAPVETKEEKAKSQKELRRKNFYKGFVQSATLTNGVEEKTVSSDSSSEDDEDSSKNVNVPTLDDIHKFCGGATGHKAASFGFRLGGKVKRATHHEKTFEEQIKDNELDGSKNIVGDDSLLELNSDDGEVKKKKKKKKSSRKDEEKRLEDEEVMELPSSHTENQGVNPAKRKLEDLQQDNEDQSCTDVSPKKKKKKKKDKEEDKLESLPSPEEAADIVSEGSGDRKKKKKKKSREIEEEPTVSVEEDKREKKKRKKNKKDKL